MSKVVRSVKNVTKGYSTVQVKVRNATSNDPWGPTGTEMAEIAAMTFNNPSDFYEIMDMLDKRLNDKGKNWRHVLKSLKVLDYCLHEGSELVVTWAHKNVYIIKTLREFTYIDEEGRDVGQNVRVSAKELTSLILDEERLRSERSDRKLWKSRVTGIDENGPSAIAGPNVRGAEDRRNRRNQRADEEDAEYRLAIEASKYEAEEEAKRRGKGKSAEDDDDLAKAIKLSKEEEDLRRRELEDQNAASLFDDTPAPSQPQPTGWNQGYQQQPQVDWFGNPIQQQPQNTGFLNNQYSQPTGFPQQQTGYPNYTNGFGQQPTGFDQSQFGQPNYIQQQQTSMNNPYAQQQQPQPQLQQNDLFGQSSSPQTYQQPGTNNPWATPNQQQADALKPMPTGSNNPFAQRPKFQPVSNSTPALSTLQEQQTATFDRPNPIANFQAPQQPQQPQQTQQPQPTIQRPANQQHAKLNALLASGEGQDTFGNTGDLRIPAQHTAPGVFVNSAGVGADRMRAAQTGGNNPFFSQQFTGQPQAQMQMPAQTGPANGFGGQSSNPFGARPPGGQAQGGSLIDL
ncbi:MAG: hypothetical protein Q9227_009352 [Pyrenula ochraceoflavens]